MSGLFVENGPCQVNADSNSTRPADWSWNEDINMLYVKPHVRNQMYVRRILIEY